MQPLSRGLSRLLANRTARSVVIGAAGSVVDFCVLMTAAKGFGLPAPAAAACGVTVGATANFLLNRRYAFEQHGEAMSRPALRFALGTAVLIAIHAAVVGALTRMDAPLLVAKYGADVSLLLGGNLLLLRFFVFTNRPVADAATNA